MKKFFTLMLAITLILLSFLSTAYADFEDFSAPLTANYIKLTKIKSVEKWMEKDDDELGLLTAVIMLDILYHDGKISAGFMPFFDKTGIYIGQLATLNSFCFCFTNYDGKYRNAIYDIDSGTMTLYDHIIEPESASTEISALVPKGSKMRMLSTGQIYVDILKLAYNGAASLMK